MAPDCCLPTDWPPPRRFCASAAVNVVAATTTAHTDTNRNIQFLISVSEGTNIQSAILGKTAQIASKKLLPGR
jgi:hypothetical protein